MVASNLLIITSCMTEVSSELIDQFSGKRFLFVLGQFGKLGGAERQALILAEQLQHTVGCEVAFLAWAAGARIESELKSLDIPGYAFSLNWMRSGRIGRLRTLRRLAKFVRSEIRPDYLLPYIGFNCKIMGMIWKKCGAQFTWWNQRDEGRDIFGSRMEDKVIRSVPSVVSNSFEGQDFLVNRFGIKPHEVEVINNGIRIPETHDSSGWRKKLNIPPDGLLITMMANLTAFKDHETLIRAFAELRKTPIGKRCHLCLAGRHGETALTLKALGFDLNLSDCLHLPGAVEATDELWAATDLAVHSSVKEGCPNAALEAMAHGLPVCGTNISGMRQALGDSMTESVLAAPKNVEHLSAIMQQLLLDDSERAELGQRNLSRVREHFSPVGLTENVLRLISAAAVA